MPQWAALALLRPVRRFEGIPYGNAQNAAGRLQSEAERHLRGFFDVAVTGHMSDMPCRARLHRGYGAPGTDGHGRAMPEKCRLKVSEKWPLKLHPAFSGSGSALKGHSKKCERAIGPARIYAGPCSTLSRLLDTSQCLGRSRTRKTADDSRLSECVALRVGMRKSPLSIPGPRPKLPLTHKP